MIELTYQLDSGESESITFDASVRENHRGKARATERNVSEGEPITDHVEPSPRMLSIRAVVSNTPVRTPRTLADGAQGEVQSLKLRVPFKGPWTGARYQRTGGVSVSVAGSGTSVRPQGEFEPVNENAPEEREQEVGLNVLQFDAEFDRVRNVYRALDTLRSEGTVVAVLTSLQRYQDMVIESVEAPRTAKDGEAVTFRLDLKQIRRATTEQVQAPEPREPRGREKKSRGKQQADNKSDSDPQEAEDDRSLAASTLDAITGG
jgi:hypothetical protein